MGHIVEIEGVNKIYGKNHVVKDLNLTVEEGEFLTLLGSSGCGKTTTLRMIAGFEEPTSGSIKVEGENIEEKEPFERNVNTVFQSYALFPHKTIFDNIAYGLKMKKVPKAEIKERVLEMMELVQLEGFEKRYPSQLSGGQKQRVAIARALINRPRVLLLDEPSNGLDIPSKIALRKSIAENITEEQTVIISTHQVKDLESIIDPIIILDHKGVLLNRSVEEISEKLHFSLSANECKEALYSQQQFNGFLTIKENLNGEETKPDLEALFNCCLSNKERIKELFK